MGSNPYDQPFDIERLYFYRPGGFHPVHLDDKFKDGRYTVINKLGHGTFSTVWLVRDEVEHTYASLKILMADATKYSTGEEHEVLQRSASGSGAGKRYVLQFLDSFVHDGPNGSHLCLVTELSGPPLATYLDCFLDDGYETPESLPRVFVTQLAKAVEYLHSCNIIHGDLHLGNILYHSSAITFTSDSDVLKYFGEPDTEPMCLRKGATPTYGPPHVPEYVVYPPDVTDFLEAVLANPCAAEIRLCDFSEASLYDPVTHPDGVIKRKLNCPSVYAAPEVIFDDVASPATDIWALGNVMHQILTGGAEWGELFISDGMNSTVSVGRPSSRDEVVGEMVRRLGQLPERWWDRWEARTKFHDENAPPPNYQRKAFSKVLEGIFRFEPLDRLSASELVKALASLEEEEPAHPAPPLATSPPA